MKFSVIQPGARLHYAVPEILAQAGLLRTLFTDLHSDHAWLRSFDHASRLLLSAERQPRMVRRLLGRHLPANLSASLVEDLPVRTIVHHLAEVLGWRSMGISKIPLGLLAKLEASRLAGGDVVYTVLVNEDLDTLRRIKERGVRVVHECMMSPDIGLWLLEEHSRFPEFEPKIDPVEVEAGRQRDKEKYDLADLILAPSEFVATAVRKMVDDTEKVRVVPYGLDVGKFGSAGSPIPGEVLFVGSVRLLKGIPYLAIASQKLSRRNPRLRVKVVGPIYSRIEENNAMSGPTYIGQVPRSMVKEHYRTADVFVLPTLCEGMALVHLEAMAAGVPVITTPNCGSVVRDGIDGFIVPVRDPDALADRIEQIVGDRALRQRMSEAARERAREYSLPRYAERLLGALSTLAD